MDNYDSESHTEHTFAVEEPFHSLDDVCLCEQVDEVSLLLPLFVRVMLFDFHVSVVVVIDFADDRLVDRKFQPCYPSCQSDKSATAMCV